MPLLARRGASCSPPTPRATSGLGTASLCLQFLPGPAPALLDRIVCDEDRMGNSLSLWPASGMAGHRQAPGCGIQPRGPRRFYRVSRVSSQHPARPRCSWEGPLVQLGASEGVLQMERNGGNPAPLHRGRASVQIHRHLNLEPELILLYILSLQCIIVTSMTT